MATPSQQSAIDALNPGDLVLLTSTLPHNPPLMLKVHRISSTTGTVHVWGPRFSLRQHVLHTWSISGNEVCYTGTIDECSDPSLAPASRAENYQGTLQPLETHETLHVRPGGVDALRLYWRRRCPYWRCRNHMMCVGAGGEDLFPELQACMALCCPVCMGYEFACEDKELLGRLEREVAVDVGSVRVARLVRERLCRIERRRVELGYEVVVWNLGVGRRRSG